MLGQDSNPGGERANDEVTVRPCDIVCFKSALTIVIIFCQNIQGGGSEIDQRTCPQKRRSKTISQAFLLELAKWQKIRRVL